MPATYEPIATTTLASPASSITFSSITGSWTDLRLVFVFTPTASLRARLDLNGDSGTNYSSTLLVGDGTNASSTRYSNVVNPNFYNANNSTIAMVEVDFLSYTDSLNKTFLTKYFLDTNGSGRLAYGVSLWRSTAAINTIRLFASSSTFEPGTTATLYGILKA